MPVGKRVKKVRLTQVFSTNSQKKNTLSCSTTSLLRAWRWIWINQIKRPQTPMLLSWISIDDASSITDTILSKATLFTYIYISNIVIILPPLCGGARALTNHTRTALYIFFSQTESHSLFRFHFLNFLTATPRSLKTTCLTFCYKIKLCGIFIYYIILDRSGRKKLE